MTDYHTHTDGFIVVLWGMEMILNENVEPRCSRYFMVKIASKMSVGV